MKIKHFKIYSLVLASAMMFTGCGDDFLDINENPNVATEGQLGLLLTSAQANIGGEFTTGLGFGGAVYARQYYGLGASTYAITGATYQGDWNSLYTGSLKDLREIVLTGEATDNFAYQGISKVLTAYVYHQLVDYFGDIPYSEALQGETIISPVFDTDASIYTALLASLDDAISDLDLAIANGDLVSGDLMYSGNYANWIAAANTLKLKMYLNLGNVSPAVATAGIDAILADGRIIDTSVEDWQLNFTSDQVPNGRHPFYNSEYSTSPGYLDNFMMLSMVQDNDPRLRYYFYRQATYGSLDFQTTPCSSRSDCATWDALLLTGTNYIGRDHGDPSGLPGDDNLVTVPGVYPFGGKWDDSSYNTVNANSSNPANTGALGAGFMPFFTSSMTHFMLAEANLNLGVTTPTTAVGHYEAGMQASFDKVRAYSMSTTEGDFIDAWESDTLIHGADAQGASAFLGYDSLATAYIDDKVADFNSASAGDQLNLVMIQKSRSNWGNGMESYTDLRRTNLPNTYPASLAPQGPFPARVIYPDSEIASNPNAPGTVIPQSTPVFWDN